MPTADSSPGFISTGQCNLIRGDRPSLGNALVAFFEVASLQNAFVGPKGYTLYLFMF